VPPSTVTPPNDLDAEAAMSELEQKFPGRAAHMETHQTGLHTTATIDLIHVVDGEIWLELDDNKEVHLKTGDSLVQNGVRHAWRNHGTKPCTLVVTIIGANIN
jgi:quercetin dioxygenase-like cupin family protein